MKHSDLFPRNIVTDIEKWLDAPEVIVILGGRQVGKTSTMKLLMEKLKPGDYAFFDLEDSYNLNIFSSIETFMDYLKAKGYAENSKLYVFIDEFQYMPEPSKFLKLIHDHHKRIKLIVSGSSSFELQRTFTDGITGRKVVFALYPLSFGEYLTFKKNDYAEIKKKLSLNTIIAEHGIVKKYSTLTPKVASLFEDFILYGGYPMPALTEDREQRIVRLKEIHNTYIQKDIKDLAKIENIILFNKLVSYLAVQTGGLLNLNEIGNETGITRRHVEKYLFILEKTFVIKMVKPFFTNRQKELTKMSKLYFCDTGMRNINISDMRALHLRPDRGALAENAFLQETLKSKNILQETHFWRTMDHQEVDFIITENRQPLPVEIKYQNMRNPEMPPSLRFFIEKFNPDTALIITKDYADQTKYGKTTILYVPLWMV